MRILVTGSSGLIGSALIPFLESAGNKVVRLVRFAAAPNATELFWNPEAGVLDRARLEAFDAVVHLAGDNLAEGRWSRAKKHRIRESRVAGTRLLCRSLAQLSHPPQMIASASGVGFYGNRLAEELTERSAPGSGFLAEVCQEWEAATNPAVTKGIRVVHLRFGVVLSRRGGALQKMLLPFQVGLGGRLGNGKQYWSWIAIEDAVRAVGHVVNTPSLAGPVNVVSPEPVTNLEFTRTLGQTLSRPTFLAVPRFAARVAFGEMAEEALLASARVHPVKLLASDFVFRHPRLAETLRGLLGK